MSAQSLYPAASPPSTTATGHHRRPGHAASPTTARSSRLYFRDLLTRARAALSVELRDELGAFVARHRDEGLFTALCAARRFPHLVTLNCGLGRDSIAMLCLLSEGRLVMEGQTLRPVDVDAVVFSDTGAEWPATYALIPKVSQLCADMGVPFFVLEKPPERGERGWQDNPRAKGDRTDPAWLTNTADWSLAEKAAGGVYHRRLPIREEYMRLGTIAVTVNASCTDNHKVQPIRRWLNDLCIDTFGASTRSWGVLVRKGLRERHRVLIGIAADEASRAINTGRPSYEWAVYPLLEAGITKDDEGAILQRHGFDGFFDLPVLKSGCYLCPYQPVGWFWVLSEQHPDLFARVEEYEATALARNPKMHILRGMPITEAVTAWRARNPRATHEAVLRKSYDRCIAPTTGRGGKEPAA